jgi:uncharacterized protein YjiK
MITKLKIAIEKASRLPTKKQKKSASIILDEISWDNSFDKSQDQLLVLAHEATCGEIVFCLE